MNEQFLASLSPMQWAYTWHVFCMVPLVSIIQACFTRSATRRSILAAKGMILVWLLSNATVVGTGVLLFELIPSLALEINNGTSLYLLLLINIGYSLIAYCASLFVARTCAIAIRWREEVTTPACTNADKTDAHYRLSGHTFHRLLAVHACGIVVICLYYIWNSELSALRLREVSADSFTNRIGSISIVYINDANEVRMHRPEDGSDRLLHALDDNGIAYNLLPSAHNASDLSAACVLVDDEMMSGYYPHNGAVDPSASHFKLRMLLRGLTALQAYTVPLIDREQGTEASQKFVARPVFSRSSRDFLSIKHATGHEVHLGIDLPFLRSDNDVAFPATVHSRRSAGLDAWKSSYITSITSSLYVLCLGYEHIVIIDLETMQMAKIISGRCPNVFVGELRDLSVGHD